MCMCASVGVCLCVCVVVRVTVRVYLCDVKFNSASKCNAVTNNSTPVMVLHITQLGISHQSLYASKFNNLLSNTDIITLDRNFL